MKSIEKLREQIKYRLIGGEQDWYALADEIEREIAERYMELPVDADGVPIHEDDLLVHVEGGGPVTVCSLSAKFFCYYDGFEKKTGMCSEYRHVKPDPVKELLEEFATDLENYKRDDVDFDCFADRIREAVEK